jgi:hypothetical protein
VKFRGRLQSQLSPPALMPPACMTQLDGDMPSDQGAPVRGKTPQTTFKMGQDYAFHNRRGPSKVELRCIGHQ